MIERRPGELRGEVAAAERGWRVRVQHVEHVVATLVHEERLGVADANREAAGDVLDPARDVLGHVVGVDRAEESADVPLDRGLALGREIEPALQVVRRRELDLREAVVRRRRAAQTLMAMMTPK